MSSYIPSILDAPKISFKQDIENISKFNLNEDSESTSNSNSHLIQTSCYSTTANTSNNSNSTISLDYYILE